MFGSTIKDDVRDALCGFYCDQGLRFWQVFEETPRASVTAFKKYPEIFGALDRHYARWDKSKLREHSRISDLMELLLERMGLSD